ncbi:hypothetical protein [Antribacter gilvus]|uniref:hypothetical protein n=1 Tax=Antribacter gilvus TaxID=2304675 RepID=UPI000F7AEA12|nr:hypothetical protein [Antribacter gilvus]
MKTEEVIAVLSRDRLGPYVRRAGSDDDGLALYEWNGEVGGALHACLGYAEVVLRNALHEQLSRIAQDRRFSDPWYVSLAPLLDLRAQADVASARDRATRNGRTETEGRVIAELTFGFWRYLVSAKYDRTLWRVGLHRAFPHLNATLRQVSKLLQRLNDLRNRIAHHEPIFNRDLAQLHRDVDQLMRWLDADLATWRRLRCPVDQLLTDPRAAVGPQGLSGPT